jgi:steroid 5-alpha reductase family enzyme
MIEGLLGNAAILLGLVLLLWAVSLQIDDVSFIDAFWGGGMALLALASWLRLADPGPLATLLMAMTVLWGGRLAIHLFRRWRREGEDPRYARMMRKPREQGRFAIAALTKVFLGQAVLLFIVSSPAQAGIIAAGAVQPISGLALVGLALWLVGIFFEWVGDWQLARFRADPASKGQVMDRGLWRYTRHPNYFGDACAWWGIWLAAASAGWWIAAWTVVGPLFLTFTLTRWSGKPLLEAGMAKRRPGYADYVRRTSGFFPLPPKKA